MIHSSLSTALAMAAMQRLSMNMPVHASDGGTVTAEPEPEPITETRQQRRQRERKEAKSVRQGRTVIVKGARDGR